MNQMRRHIEAKIRQARGGHVACNVLKAVSEMDEATAEQWFRILQNVELDAETRGKREGARQPWGQF